VSLRKHIPNFITCLNIISGCLAVIFALKGQLTAAVFLILAGAFFDFFDGMAARALKAYSAIGKDLDSLADVITFGLAPGMIMYVLLQDSFAVQNSHMHYSIGQNIILSFSLLIPVFSALRLAKFNNDTRQTSSFIGLPTPANAIFICSLALIHNFGKYNAFDHLILSTETLLFLTFLLSYLLVSEIPMFSLKFKNLRWKDNKIRVIFLILSLILIIAFSFYGIAATIISFVLLSFLQNLNKKVV
jgi:CDP-diacylglycerol---serine O-phosphatidyltransferase